MTPDEAVRDAKASARLESALIDAVSRIVGRRDADTPWPHRPHSFDVAEIVASLASCDVTDDPDIVVVTIREFDDNDGSSLALGTVTLAEVFAELSGDAG